jgi:hypothetical protein
MSSSDNEQANELVQAPTPPNGQRRVYQAIVAPGFFAAVVVTMAGWLYLLGEVFLIIFDWLFG